MLAAPPLTRNRNFLLLQSGQLLSTVGSQAASVAFPLLALALTHSPAKAGIVGFAGILPLPLLLLPAGVLVDRFDRKRVMVVCDAARALGALSLALALLAGHGTYWHLLVVAFLESCFFAFFNLAEIGALRAVVGRSQLPEAMAWEQSRWGIVILGGPPLGGLLFGLGRALPFLFDSVSYAFSTLSVLAIRVRFQEERTEPFGRIRDDLAEGFRFLWAQPFLRTCALLFVGSNFVWNGLFLVIVVAGRRQGLSGAEIGLLIAFFGASGLVGGTIAPTLQRRLSVRAIVLLPFWLALGVGAFVVHPDVWLLVGGLVPFGLLNPALNSTVIGYRTAVTPDRLQGRVNGVARMLSQLGGPLGPLVAGGLLSTVSARETVLVFTAALAALAVAATVLPAMRDAPSLAELATE
jgi:MFS family permease